MVHWSGEMKHIIVVIIAVLSVLHRDVLCSKDTGCPRRYLRRINGKCYYFSVKKLNWFGALNNCLRKGLTLADLSNPRDFYGVVEFLSSKGNTEDFWFGANDLQTEGRYQYISNGRLVRYFSNYSIVELTEHSPCDDCLEVRIRNNMTVVADDNCLERQYFICSERYCDFVDVAKKRHHSHEHLHHFHHDIGEPSDEAELEPEPEPEQEPTPAPEPEPELNPDQIGQGGGGGNNNNNQNSQELVNPPPVEVTDEPEIEATTEHNESANSENYPESQETTEGPEGPEGPGAPTDGHTQPSESTTPHENIAQPTQSSPQEPGENANPNDTTTTTNAPKPGENPQQPGPQENGPTEENPNEPPANQ